MTPFFFTIFTGFSVFWMTMAAKGGGVFWMFGLIFFAVGAFNLVGIHFWQAYRRRNTFYTLTDKRAFIARDINNTKTLHDYPITAATKLTYKSGTYDDIIFGYETRHTNGRLQRKPIRFERLKSGREVFEKMRQVQQAKRGMAQ